MIEMLILLKNCAITDFRYYVFYENLIIGFKNGIRSSLRGDSKSLHLYFKYEIEYI